jgi:prevent-host-death family protein
MAAGFAVKTISMLDFRNNAEKIIAQVQKGQRMVLTRRGKPVARLEPITKETPNGDDPFYSLNELSDPAGESLTNAQIDDILYGQ